jgi:PII-like signaling protein
MFEQAEVLQIFVAADDRHGERLLYEAVVEACREHRVAGVTVIRNVEGFDDSRAIAHEHWFRHEEPVAIIVVDRADRLDRLADAVTPWLEHGIMIRSNAQVRRVERSA